MASTCKYCQAEWKAGGNWHKPDCFVVVGGNILTWKRARKFKDVAGGPGVEDTSPSVLPMKGFEKPE